MTRSFSFEALWRRVSVGPCLLLIVAYGVFVSGFLLYATSFLWLAHLDWVALAIGTTGTILWSQNGRFSKWAAVWWLVSSFFWVAFSWMHGLPALGLRDLISILLYVYGAWRWLLRTGTTESAA